MRAQKNTNRRKYVEKTSVFRKKINKVYRFRFYPIGRGEHLDLIVPCLYRDPRFSVMSIFEEFRVVLYHDILRKSVMKYPSQFDEKISSFKRIIKMKKRRSFQLWAVF